MGADINAFAERRTADSWEICRRADGSIFVPPCVGDRDRVLFAALGAYPWCPQVEPICPPRGLPVDLSAEGRDWAEQTVGKPGYVGHSWLLVAELLAFPWAERWAAAGVELGLAATHVQERFVAETLPALEALGPPDEVRLVFWVDY